MPIRPLNMHEYICDGCGNKQIGDYPNDAVCGIIGTLNERFFVGAKAIYREFFACQESCLIPAIDSMRKKANEASAQNQMG